jgi:hypothetical protein
MRTSTLFNRIRSIPFTRLRVAFPLLACMVILRPAMAEEMLPLVRRQLSPSKHLTLEFRGASDQYPGQLWIALTGNPEGRYLQCDCGLGITSADFSPDERFLVVSYANAGADRNVLIFERIQPGKYASQNAEVSMLAWNRYKKVHHLPVSTDPTHLYCDDYTIHGNPWVIDFAMGGDYAEGDKQLDFGPAYFRYFISQRKIAIIPKQRHSN